MQIPVSHHGVGNWRQVPPSLQRQEMLLYQRILPQGAYLYQWVIYIISQKYKKSIGYDTQPASTVIAGL